MFKKLEVDDVMEIKFYNLNEIASTHLNAPST